MSNLQTTTPSDAQLVSFLDVMGLTPKLSTQQKTQFVEIAKLYGLNPFKREIYCTVYGEGQYQQFSIITGYEVYLKRAERSGLLSGWNATTSGSVATGDLKATVTIFRKDREHPFIWETHYEECVQKTKDGQVTKFWEKANFMSKKVCISQAFRLCFSDELGGMPYTADEIATEEITHDITAEVVKPKITGKQLESIITRIENGENGVIEKALSTFGLTPEQCQKIITTKVNV